MLDKTFQSNSSSENYDKEFLKIKNSIEDSSINYSQIISKRSGPLNVPITKQEVNEVINMSTRHLGRMGFQAFSYLPVEGKEALLNIYNFMFKSKTFPNKWETATVMPFLNQAKQNQTRLTIARFP